MADAQYDHAIIGSGPLAGLVAGLLASEHKRRVVLVGETYSPFRLQRGHAVSIDVLTRPETLMLLRRVGAETGKLVAALGKGLIDRLDPLFIGETPATNAALGHFRQMAKALGYAVEPHADRNLADGTMCRVREATMLVQGRIEPALEAWHQSSGVLRLDAADCETTLRRDGSLRIVAGGREIEAAHAVLADDAAILAHIPADQRDKPLAITSVATLLIEQARTLPASLVTYLDRGVVLQQVTKVGISALVSGDPLTVRPRLAASVVRGEPVRSAGETQFARLVTTDGAPLVSGMRSGKPLVLAGLGDSGAFLAPAIARLIAGTSPADEAAWFAARGSLRGNQRRAVADFIAVAA